MPDEAVWAGGDQSVLWLDAEFEGEERTEGFVTLQADEGSEGHQENSEPSDRRDGEVGYFAGMRGGRAEGGCGEPRRVLWGSEDVVGDGQELQGAGDVKQRPLKLGVRHKQRTKRVTPQPRTQKITGARLKTASPFVLNRPAWGALCGGAVAHWLRRI